MLSVLRPLCGFFNLIEDSKTEQSEEFIRFYVIRLDTEFLRYYAIQSVGDIF